MPHISDPLTPPPASRNPDTGPRVALNSVRIPIWAWSLALAAACISRASSYAFRPPAMTPTSAAIEGPVGYTNWAILLCAAAALIIAGLVDRQSLGWVFLFLGHLIALGCYLIFSLSIGWAAVAEDQPWSGLAPILIVAMLHAQRLLTIGADHGRR